MITGLPMKSRFIMNTSILAMAIVSLAACACSTAFLKSDDWSIQVDIVAGEEWVHPFPLFGPITKPNYPTFALWVTEEDGTYIDTVFVTKKIGDASWAYADDGRPEALPLWSKVRGGQPSSGSPVADGVSGASPRGSQAYGLTRGALPDRIYIWLEINHSVDYNASYKEGISDPDAPFYSGGKGGSGQPALVYRALVDLSQSPGTGFSLDLVGHSEAGGVWDGTDYYAADPGEITTALSIVKSATVTLR